MSYSYEDSIRQRIEFRKLISAINLQRDTLDASPKRAINMYFGSEHIYGPKDQVRSNLMDNGDNMIHNTIQNTVDSIREALQSSSWFAIDPGSNPQDFLVRDYSARWEYTPNTQLFPEYRTVSTTAILTAVETDEDEDDPYEDDPYEDDTEEDTEEENDVLSVEPITLQCLQCLLVFGKEQAKQVQLFTSCYAACPSCGLDRLEDVPALSPTNENEPNGFALGKPGEMFTFDGLHITNETTGLEFTPERFQEVKRMSSKEVDESFLNRREISNLLAKRIEYGWESKGLLVELTALLEKYGWSGSELDDLNEVTPNSDHKIDWTCR